MCLGFAAVFPEGNDARTRRFTYLRERKVEDERTVEEQEEGGSVTQIAQRVSGVGSIV